MPRPMKLLPMLLALPFASSCQTVVEAPPPDCLAFIPAHWHDPVASANVPAGSGEREWMEFGVAQSGQLAKESGQKSDILHIVGECERRALEALPRRKVLGIF